jgi:hypothetical protein
MSSNENPLEAIRVLMLYEHVMTFNPSAWESFRQMKDFDCRESESFASSHKCGITNDRFIHLPPSSAVLSSARDLARELFPSLKTTTKKNPRPVMRETHSRNIITPIKK